MANRTFVPLNFTMLKGLVALYPVINVGAAGAVTLQKRTFSAAGAGATTPKYSLVAAPTTGVGYAVGDGFGTATVARTGAGAWTITLSDSYLYLVSVVPVIANATGALTTADLIINSSTTNVTTNTSAGSGGVITTIMYNAAGSAADPNTGDQVTLQIILGNSGEP